MLSSVSLLLIGTQLRSRTESAHNGKTAPERKGFLDEAKGAPTFQNIRRSRYPDCALKEDLVPYLISGNGARDNTRDGHTDNIRSGNKDKRARRRPRLAQDYKPPGADYRRRVEELGPRRPVEAAGKAERASEGRLKPQLALARRRQGRFRSLLR